MSKFKLGQRVLATGSVEHDTEEVVNEPGTIVLFDYDGMKFKYDYRVHLDGRGFSALFTEDELTPLDDGLPRPGEEGVETVTEVFKGDKVKHTIIAVSREDTTTERIQADGWGFDVVSEEFEVLERSYPHGNPEDDPVGTVRRMPEEDEAPAYSTVKVAENSWVDLDGVYSHDFWPDRFQVDAPVIGAVPGTPAAQAARRKIFAEEAADADAWRPEITPTADPYSYYRDWEGDVWRHRPGTDDLPEFWDSEGAYWSESIVDFEAAKADWHHLEPLDRSALTKEQREA